MFIVLIGAGLMVLIIYGLITFPEVHQTAPEFAVAATCLKYSISGDINLVTVNEIKALMSRLGAVESRDNKKVNLV